MATEASERPSGPYGNQVGEALYQNRAMAIAELARRVGVERRDMSWIVNGHKLPTAEQLDRMCQVLGWTAEQLYPTEAFRAAIEATRREADPA